MKSLKLWSKILVLLFPFLFFMGCGGGGGGGMGQLSVSLTDASGPWESVWVAIDKAEVHCDGSNWQTVANFSPPLELDLLKFTNGVRVPLGLVDFPVGHCTQVRLILDPATAGPGLNELFQVHSAPNYAVDTSHNICPLALSSEDQTGIKLNHEFDVTTGWTDILLDFDASNSIVVEGNGTCRLKPVINISSTIEEASVSGRVVNGSVTPNVALAGAQVSAQIPNPPPDELFVVQGVPANTGADGSYKLLLQPSPPDYNIVAYKQGFTADVIGGVNLAAGTDTPLGDLLLDDLSLAIPPLSDGTLTGLVTISGSDASTFATLSFRTVVKGQLIEVTSVNVQNNTSYTVPLPPGTYKVEAFSFDQHQQIPVNLEVVDPVSGTSDIVIVAGKSTTENVTFPTTP